MARLASQADLGFKPLPIEAAYNIGTFIAPCDHPQARIFDPCVGEGEAIQVIARGIGIPKERRYACELHDSRATTAAERVGNLVIADTLKGLQASRHAFVVGYLNPPFDNDDKSEGGGRLETKFLYRAVEEGRWIQSGGVAVIVTPQYVMARQAFITHLARCYDDIQVFALREDIREFNEAVAFGVVREKFRTSGERRDEEERLAALLAGDLPVLVPQDVPHYRLPEPEARKKGVIWKDSTRGTPTMALQEVCTHGGAWNGDAYRQATAALRQRQRLNPKFPLHPGQRVFRIAAGEVNGRILEFDGQSWTIKGSTIEQIHQDITSSTAENSRVTKSMVIKRKVPVITAVNTDGLIRQYIGAEGIGKLLSDSAVSAALSEAVTEAAPPTYQMDMEPWLEELLGSITPKKALPGYEPGLLPMQKHVISAAYRALTTHDPVWGRTPNSVVIAAEMGCGKTAMGLVSAHALITAHPPKGRAPTIIVTGPGHLIGTRQQVVEFFRDGKGSLPPWYKEWFELLPNYHLEVLESPADVGDFFRGAEADPATPRVGFISNTKLSLGSGYECGAQDHTNAKAAWAHFRRYHDLEEVERAEFAQKKKKGGSQAESDATAEEEANKDKITHPHLESPRTRRRDELLRTAPGHPRLRNGLTCPTCGTLVRTGSKGDPADEKSLRKKGLARLRCHHCGEPLGQMSRERDNVQDRERAVFQSEEWLQGHPDIPWGEIPQSNPRYPLGKLIRNRYKGKVDVYLADEVHDYKGATTAVGAAFGALASTSRWAIGLTGTLYGGYGSTLYSLFLRMGNVPILQEYGWHDEKRFIRENGVVAEITTEVLRANEDGHYSGEPSVRTEIKELPGVTASLGAVVQNQSIQVLLKHMGFNLVDYVEDAVILDMPDEVAPSYRLFANDAKSVVSFGGEDALGAYLQALLTYPYQPWREKVVRSERKREEVRSEVLPDDLVLPHLLAGRIRQPAGAGRAAGAGLLPAHGHRRPDARHRQQGGETGRRGARHDPQGRRAALDHGQARRPVLVVREGRGGGHERRALQPGPGQDGSRPGRLAVHRGARTDLLALHRGACRA